LFNTNHPARRARVTAGAIGTSSFAVLVWVIATEAESETSVDLSAALGAAPGQPDQADDLGLSGGATPMPGDTTLPGPPNQAGGIEAETADPASPETTAEPGEDPTSTTAAPEPTPTTPAPSTSQPPATEAPTTQPPATEAPTTQPPTTQPPATEAPTTQPPTTQPPSTTTTVSGGT
jgi:outer membrane biosynthesis protein TonB